RMYAKYGLSLFETLDAERDTTGSESGEKRADDGPVAAVLRRRRARQARRRGGGGRELEDVSDEHYQKLHRKPEYVEKRVRNREIELYQYARWQEGQRLESERRRQQLLGYGRGLHTPTGDGTGSAGHDAGTQLSSGRASPLPGPAGLVQGGDGPAQGSQKRARHTVDARLGLMVLRDGSGLPPRGEGGLNTHGSASDGSTAGDAVETRSAAGSVAGGPSTGTVPSAAHALLTESERRAAHIGGCILEQFMVLAERLPEPMSLPESQAEIDDESLSTSASSGTGGTSSGDNAASVPESANASDGEQADDDEQDDGEQDNNGARCPGCAQCCPHDFVLPQRLFGHLLRQRDAERGAESDADADP
ncbi:hypothetical protein H4R19_006300, partial [Coemansia spiralis]